MKIVVMKVYTLDKIFLKHTLLNLVPLIDTLGHTDYA